MKHTVKIPKYVMFVAQAAPIIPYLGIKVKSRIKVIITPTTVANKFISNDLDDTTSN